MAFFFRATSKAFFFLMAVEMTMARLQNITSLTMMFNMKRAPTTNPNHIGSCRGRVLLKTSPKIIGPTFSGGVNSMFRVIAY
jgi:hypothetical protein